MKLDEIAKRLHLECLTPELKSEAEADVTRGYVSDLLSDVLANAPQGGVLVTVQVHMNVLAVCLNAEVAGVIFAHGRGTTRRCGRRRSPSASRSTFRASRRSRSSASSPRWA